MAVSSLLAMKSYYNLVNGRESSIYSLIQCIIEYIKLILITKYPHKYCNLLTPHPASRNTKVHSRQYTFMYIM